MNEGARGVHDPEATLVGNLEQPQIISPPIESENPLETNIRHTREPEYLERHGLRTPAQEFAHQNRHDPGPPRRGPGMPHEPRKKAYMYADHHFTDTVEVSIYLSSSKC